MTTIELQNIDLSTKMLDADQILSSFIMKQDGKTEMSGIIAISGDLRVQDGTMTHGNSSYAQKNAIALQNSKAYGAWSISLPKGTTYGYQSIGYAEGCRTGLSNFVSDTYTKQWMGTMSFAHGHTSEAIGSFSHSEGQNTLARGFASHAEGKYSKAGSYVLSPIIPLEDYLSAHLTTKLTACIQPGGILSGYTNLSNDFNVKTYDKTLGYALFEDPSFNTETKQLSTNILPFIYKFDSKHFYDSFFKINYIGSNSHAEGNATESLGDASHTEGNACYTSISAAYSHAEGDTCRVSAFCSHADGYTARIMPGHDYSYVWSGDRLFPSSNGQGSFSIYPKNGLSGLYIYDANSTHANPPNFIECIVRAIEQMSSTQKQKIANALKDYLK